MTGSLKLRKSQNQSQLC